MTDTRRVVSVRTKLIGLVLGAFVPAIVGAVAAERASERELLEEAALHIKDVGRHFDDLLDDYERHALLAVEFASHDPHFDQALARRDEAEVRAFVDQIAAAYPHHEIIATDSEGGAIALGNEAGGLSSLPAEASPAFAQLFRGERVSGLFGISQGHHNRFGLVDASPVMFEGAQVGALALITPIDRAYVQLLATQLDAELVLSVDGEVIATTDGHPASSLRTERESVAFEEVGSRLLAVETFHPRRLQTHGHEVLLTATRDVSQLRDAARSDLYRHLGLLGIAALLALGVALRYAHQLAKGVEGIAKAARALREGRYEPAPPIKTGDEMELLADNYNEMVRGLEERDHIREERDRIRETFGRYVTRQVADHLMANEQQLGGELVPVTVLFSDIRAFTTISESMSPHELLDFLNEYFTGMVESILNHRGVVDKFIGDAIMAVFGAPSPEEQDPLQAVLAALEMGERLQAINEDFAKRGLPEIRTGIGLHYGQVVAGNMGHSERMEYTVIGDTVNVASRLEGLTKKYACDILISGQLYELVEHAIDAELLDHVQVKGREERVAVYRVIGERPAAGVGDAATGA